MTNFKRLGLSEPFLKALSDLGFEKPTEIQEIGIPKLLSAEQDFIGLAQTGTGKTAAFGLPLLEKIDLAENSTQALILAPTRELGQQIANQLKEFASYQKGLSLLAVYGGAAISVQIKALRKPQHIIIATPGRLIDLIQRKAVKLDKIKYLILDEADEMLNMGFKEEIDRILSHTPDHKSTWLFSATMPKEISRIVSKYMQNPTEVRVNGKNEVNADIAHRYASVNHRDKLEALTRFMDSQPEMRGVVFCRTKRDTQELADSLLQRKYNADAIHGDLSQRQRDTVMNRFKANSLQVLVATDVAARGIDVNDLTHVFHYNLPDDVSYYTHRSGRTARAGKKGTSIAFVSGRDKGKLHHMAKELKIDIEPVTIPQAVDIAQQRVDTWCKSILDKKTKGKIDPEILENAKTLFGGLSKDELIAKVLMNEIEEIAPASKEDLNQKKDEKSSSNNQKSFRRDKGKRNWKKNRKPHSRSNKTSGKSKKKKRAHYSW